MSRCHFVFRFLFFIISLGLFIVPAQGGVFSSAAKETLELIGRKAAKETSEKSAQELAERLLRESSDDALRALLKKYGEGASRLICKPERVQLLDSLGDEAAEALLKHGSMAERLLLKKPEKETARFLATADANTVRHAEILLQKCASGQKEGSALMNYIVRHPKLVTYPTVVAAGICGAYVWARQHEDECIAKMMLCLLQHPVAAVSLLLVAVALLSSLWWLIKRRVLRWMKNRIK